MIVLFRGQIGQVVAAGCQDKDDHQKREAQSAQLVLAKPARSLACEAGGTKVGRQEKKGLHKVSTVEHAKDGQGSLVVDIHHESPDDVFGRMLKIDQNDQGDFDIVDIVQSHLMGRSGWCYQILFL